MVIIIVWIYLVSTICILICYRCYYYYCDCYYIYNRLLATQQGYTGWSHQLTQAVHTAVLCDCVAGVLLACC